MFSSEPWKFTPRTKDEARKGAVVNNIFAELLDGLNPNAKDQGATSIRINPLTGGYETIDVQTDKVVRNMTAQLRKAEGGRSSDQKSEGKLAPKKKQRQRKSKTMRLAELSEKAGEDLSFFLDIEQNLDKQEWYSKLEKDIQAKTGSPLPLPSFDFLQCIQHKATKYFHDRGLIPAAADVTVQGPLTSRDPPRKKQKTSTKGKEKARSSESETDSETKYNSDSGDEEVAPMNNTGRKKAPSRSERIPVAFDGLALVCLAMLVQEHAYMTICESGMDPEYVKDEMEGKRERSPSSLSGYADSEESGSDVTHGDAEDSEEDSQSSRDSESSEGDTSEVEGQPEKDLAKARHMRTFASRSERQPEFVQGSSRHPR